MDVLEYLFLENPLTVWFALGLAEVVVALVWHQTRSRRAAVVLVALPLAAVAVGLVEVVVETDREKLERTLDTLAEAVEAGDVGRFMSAVSERYEAREALEGVARAGLAQFTATAARPAITEQTADTATVRQTYYFRFRSDRPGAARGVRPVQWEGTFVKDPDGEWRLASAVSTSPIRVRPENALGRLPG